jgi:hypothetical protein
VGIDEDLNVDDGDYSPEEDPANVPICALVSKILDLNLPNLQDANNALCVKPQSIVAGENGTYEAKDDLEDIWEVEEMDIAANNNIPQEETDHDTEEDGDSARSTSGSEGENSCEDTISDMQE